MNYPEINLKEYQYVLPENKIPDRPLPQRDLSKLLIYKNSKINHTVFNKIHTLLPADSFLVFNNSKVIPARLHFTTENGALIEILCLQPIKTGSSEPENTESWKCIVGNVRRWKEGKKLKQVHPEFELTALLQRKNGEDNEIIFIWTGPYSFLEILEKTGEIPLPPYMNRAADNEDNVRYQTVYAKNPGSVAAPTAGLHFTEEIINLIKENGHKISSVTLHVGAGTFKPVKSESVHHHKMHEEMIEVSKEFLESILYAKNVIAVGTTSMRTLESLCVLGEKLAKGSDNFEVHQWDGFLQEKISAFKSISLLLLWLNQNEKTIITVKTSIMIIPGYQFRICTGLITNFHQPESTLVLLVAAFLGENWKKVYDYALENDFRFLSYGDSSILLP